MTDKVKTLRSRRLQTSRDPTLLGLTQVDVDELSSPAVYQDVHHVAIAQSQDVAH